jgi:Tol biopolymer transport system component
LRDLLQGTTEIVSLSSTGEQDCCSTQPTVSADGRRVAFVSNSRLAPGAPAGLPNVYVRDRGTDTTQCVTTVVGAPGSENPFGFVSACISDDGRFVAFQTYADHIVPGDANGRVDVFLRDLETGSAEWLTHSLRDGVEAASEIPG